MNPRHTSPGAKGRPTLSLAPQELPQRTMDRQQQQDNGTHEFQPRHQQQGDGHAGDDDSQHTLAAYLRRQRLEDSSLKSRS